MRDVLERMPMSRLREVAKKSNADHHPEAPRVFVNRVLDMEVERRTWYAHENPGFQPFSSTAKIGEHPGGGTAAADPLVIAYDRGIRVHAAHDEARQFLEYARLTPRDLLAALIQAAKTDRRVSGPWGKNYDQIAADCGTYAQRLGFSPGMMSGKTLVCYDMIQHESGWRELVETKHVVPLFKNGQALKDAAKQARVQLLLLSKL
ncbi:MULTISPECIES: hypothetical protein [Halomonadaceae]|uniref:Uncharacterized protein n=1 Tax=Vreelandella titanicae TaxID=664683 RepID=A0AAP9NMF6_9GAMM|nr:MULTISPECIES: hypothetical protein [Halomonas]QKS24204.1 hypothetical protein FX987_01978 [Halomonas titanicae]CDG54552.1 conserved hypothetical protein [Halomonas sp. A3H3]